MRLGDERWELKWERPFLIVTCEMGSLWLMLKSRGDWKENGRFPANKLESGKQGVAHPQVRGLGLETCHSSRQKTAPEQGWELGKRLLRRHRRIVI